jgi:hypothetical protein
MVLHIADTLLYYIFDSKIIKINKNRTFILQKLSLFYEAQNAIQTEHYSV